MRLGYILISAGFLAIAAMGSRAPAATPEAASGIVKAPTCAQQWQAISVQAQPKQADVKAYAAKCMANTSVRSAPGLTKAQQDRVSACDARWKQMQAANTVGTQRYDAFAAQCTAKRTAMN